MTQTKTDNNKSFIKVIDQRLADMLIASGFSYIKEGEFYAFPSTPKLKSVLQRMTFSDVQVFAENKLRF